MPDRAYDFSIKIGGIEMSDAAKRHIASLMYEESLEETARFEFSIRESESLSLESLNFCTETEKLGQKVDFRLGLVNDLVLTFSGEVVRVAPSFPDQDPSLLKVICYDESYKLKRVPEPHLFTADEHANADSIARWIIRKHNLKPVIGTIPPEEEDDPSFFERAIEQAEQLMDTLAGWFFKDDDSYNQQDKTDWEVLSELAHRVNYNLFVKLGYVFIVPDSFFSTRAFHKFMDGKHPFTPLRLVYYPTTDDLGDENTAILQTFDPEVGSDDQRVSVEVVSWDSINKKGERFGKASLSQLDHKDEGYTEITVKSQAIETLSIRKAVSTKPAATREARQELARRAARLVKGEGVLANGNPFIRMGQTHEIVLRDLGPIGKQFSGEYLITAVRHEIDEEGMCRTSFDVRRDGLTKA